MKKYWELAELKNEFFLSRPFFCFISMKTSSPFIWGIIYFCTMDGFFRILEKTSSELICTRLYIQFWSAQIIIFVPEIKVLPFIKYLQVQTSFFLWKLRRWYLIFNVKVVLWVECRSWNSDFCNWKKWVCSLFCFCF